MLCKDTLILCHHFSKLILYQKRCCYCLEQQRSQKSVFVKLYEYGEKLSKFDTPVKGEKGSEQLP